MELGLDATHPREGDLGVRAAVIVVVFPVDVVQTETAADVRLPDLHLREDVMDFGECLNQGFVIPEADLDRRPEANVLGEIAEIEMNAAVDLIRVRAAADPESPSLPADPRHSRTARLARRRGGRAGRGLGPCGTGENQDTDGNEERNC